MPLPLGPCDIPEAVGCRVLYAAGERILGVALTAVNDVLVHSPCAPDGTDLPLRGYVTVGPRSQDPVPDYIAVGFQTLRLTADSARADRRLVIPQFRADFTVRLIESGWPTVESADDLMFAPDADVYHDISAHAFAHGETMFRALSRAALDGSLADPGCTFAQVGSMEAIDPSGGSVGWQVGVTVAVDLSGA